jgi:hydroxypyruvate isomerase
MPKFAANLTMLFGEYDFLDRFAACKEVGFRYVEYLFPYDYDAETLRDRLDTHGLQQVLFNLPAGNWGAGDRGIAADPNRVEEFRQGVDRAMVYARVLGVERMNCLAGIGIEGVPVDKQWDVLVQNLRYAASKLAEEKRTLVIEPINTYDIPGFFLNTTSDALKLLKKVRADNLKIQYDVYHMQKMEGNLTETMRRNLERIGHIQIADNPGRHQPNTGEINYRFLLGELDSMGYEGYVGLEYVPEPDTSASLGWVKELGFTL